MSISSQSKPTSNLHIRQKPIKQLDITCDDCRFARADYLEELYGLSKKSPKIQSSTLTGAATLVFGKRGLRIDEKACEFDSLYFLYEEISRIGEIRAKKQGVWPLVIGVITGVVIHPLCFLIALLGGLLLMGSSSATNIFFVFFDDDTLEETNIYYITSVSQSKKKEIYRLMRRNAHDLSKSNDCDPNSLRALSHFLSILPQ